MTNRFEIGTTPISDLFVVTRLPLRDNRGFFERTFCRHDLAEAGVDWAPVQINRSHTSRKGVARGMHYQRPPHGEAKIVSCLKGRIFDVAIDLRKSSPTYRQWHGVELGGENHRSLVIPAGFAHGFQALTDNCELLYLHSAYYTPGSEAGINLLDKTINIEWPIAITEMSERDEALPSYFDDDEGIEP